MQALFYFVNEYPPVFHCMNSNNGKKWSFFETEKFCAGNNIAHITCSSAAKGRSCTAWFLARPVG